jgi:(p)ppGpp synthase/HD superfamily hydrolase
VAKIVDGCTDSYTKPKPPWLERKTKYLERLDKEEAEILLVSLADKYYNATTIWWDLQRTPDVWSHFKASKEDILWYYCRLDQIFQEKFPCTLANEFQLVVERILGASAPYISYDDLLHRHDLTRDRHVNQTMEQPVVEEEK